jgi:PAS domain S-box-containing protein
VDCNAEACRSSGYSREELLSLSVKDFAAELASGEEQLSESGMLWRHTTPHELDAVVAGFHLTEHRRKDGTTFPVEVRVVHVDYGGKRMMLASARDTTGLKRAAEALRESEERYGRLVELSPETIAVHSEGKLVYVNAAGVRVLGAARAEELIGKPVLDLIHPDYVEFVKARMQSTREEGTTTNLAEMQVVRLDGEVIDVETRETPIVYEGLPAVQVVIRDITERKRIEEELRDSEERLRTVIHNVPVVLFVVDREGVFKPSEGKGLEGIGLESGDIVGRSIFEVFRDEPEILENTRRALSGEEFSATVDLAGSTFETRYSQLRDEGGEVAGVIGVAADVTERERAVERLEESEKRYRAIIEQTMDCVYLANVDTKCLIESNTAFRQMLGYTAEELRGMRIYDFIAHEEEDIDAVYQSILSFGGTRRSNRASSTPLANL